MTVGIRRLLTSNQRIRDAFHAALHRDADLDAALAALAPDAVLLNAPMGTGARDHDGLRRYLGIALIPHLPEDLAFRRITRTVDQRRVVDEDLVAFTHDRDLPWLLPGVPPTHRYAEVTAISIVGFRHQSHLGDVVSQITSHRTFWDLTGLLAQLRLRPSAVAAVATTPR
jgi:carboxymethylenebutenolidase